MSLKGWILVLTQEIRNPSGFDPSFSTLRAPKSISRVSAKMTASSVKSRSEILTFPNDAVIFAETLDILMGALEMLNEESEPLGLRGFLGQN